MHRFDEMNVSSGSAKWPYPNILHLGYHYVRDGKAPGPCCSPNRLRTQIQALKEHGYEIMQCGEIVSRMLRGKPLPERHATISFDDGLRDHYTAVVPILAELEVPATFFYIACTLDGKLPPVIGFQILIDLLSAERMEQEVLPFVLKGTSYADLLDPKRFDVTGRKMGEVPEMRRIKWVFNHFPSQAFKQDCISEMFARFVGFGAEYEYVENWFMGAYELGGLNDSIEVASHSYSHPSFDISGLEEIDTDLLQALQLLKRLGTRWRVASFAWPFGGSFYEKMKNRVNKYHNSAWNFHSALKEMPQDPYEDLMDIPRLHEQVFLPEVK